MNDRDFARVVLSLTSLLAAGVFLSACGARSEYYLGFLNKTGHDLSGVQVTFNGKEAGGPGNLVKGGLATEGKVTLPVPAEAEVRWADDKAHLAKVAVRNLPKRLTWEWTLYFAINQDGTVQAEAIRNDDKAALEELERGLRPKGEYRLGLVNKTGRDLTSVTIYYDSQQVCAPQELPTRAKVGYSDSLTLPIPSVAQVRWKENNTEQAVNANFEGIVPKGYERGTIYIVLRNDNTLFVKPIAWGNDKESIELCR